MPRSICYIEKPDPAYDPKRDHPPEAYKDIILSIVEFTPGNEEEIFLSYSWDRWRGPGIRRPGDRAPSMLKFDEPWRETTDPDEQRLGTSFIDEQAKELEKRNAQQALDRARKALEEAQDKGATEETIKILEEKIGILERRLDFAHAGPAYTKEFSEVYPDHELIGQQGCGDLTMNLWYVAYVNSKLNGRTMNKPLLYLQEEPVSERTYTCLVKWKKPYRVTIEEDVRFNVLSGAPWQVQISGKRADDRIEFAVSGKQVIREGKLVDLRGVVHQFADIRHLLQLPTINPKGELFPGDPGRPRFYYGRFWEDHVWFGEAQLLDDWNLQRAALVGPVVLNRLYKGMGASKEQVEGAMQLAGYSSPRDPKSLQEGEWRFIPWDDNLVEVYFKRSRYPWGMIGVDRKQERILCLACNGHQGRTGYTLEEAVNLFIDQTRSQGIEIWSALLMDEGNDVFQKAFLDRELKVTVPLRRPQLRASFIVARKTG
jgi:hypothetical protein